MVQRRIFTVPVGNLRFKFDVRKRMSDERVEHFRKLIEDGEQIPPIEVVHDLVEQVYIIIDGRHRWAAFKNLEYSEVPVVLSPVEHGHDRELIVRALMVNQPTGALPPSRDDLRRVLRQLCNLGLSDATIAKDLASAYSKATVKRELSWVRSNLMEIRVRQAAAYRDAEDCTYAAAAERFGVAEDRVRAFRQRASKKAEHALESLTRRLTGMNKTYGNNLATLLSEASSSVFEGYLEQEEFFRFLHRVQRYRKNIQDQCDECEKRVLAIMDSDNRAVAAGDGMRDATPV